MKPMLAGKFDPAYVSWPKYASAKLDGIRCLMIGGVAMSRHMKEIPNLYVQKWVHENRHELEGLDGELIVGSPTDPDVYRKTTSGIMSKSGEPDFKFYVFDDFSRPDRPYQERFPQITTRVRLCPHPYTLCRSIEELNVLEKMYLEMGYEGVMLRDLSAPYKQGRSTTREGWLLKVKRFEDAEATVVGFEEEMANGNEAKLNALGHTERSSHQANKTGKGVLGALVCVGLTEFKGIKFNIGTGFSADDRAIIWDTRDDLLGAVVKFKYFSIGVKDAPRHPVFLGVRQD